ncbi:putative membrane protein [[Clostridium] sordellii VPI 9048]|nr:putative membrane protein [[Clostridium] sordellii VPI 9048] [Paeniclostridium sordellii VPI 9048]
MWSIMFAILLFIYISPFCIIMLFYYSKYAYVFVYASLFIINSKVVYLFIKYITDR